MLQIFYQVTFTFIQNIVESLNQFQFCRIPVAFTEDPNTQKEPAKPSDKPQALAEV